MALKTRTRSTALVFGVICVVAALLYLRDPPWLIHVTSGFGPWMEEDDGTRFRWTAGRASFFIPSDVRELRLPIRSVKDTPGDWPITVTITADDRVVERVRLEDERWQELRIGVPGTSARRVRRIDLHLDRVRRGQRGVLVGEARLIRQAPGLPHD